MLLRLIAIAIPVGLIFAASLAVFAKKKTTEALTQLVGATFLLVVIFVHVSEAFGFFPWMGWGQPDTLGHYVDLTSALAGAILLSVGYIARRLNKRHNSN